MIVMMTIVMMIIVKIIMIAVVVSMEIFAVAEGEKRKFTKGPSTRVRPDQGYLP